MPWIKVADLMPQENEQILIYDERTSRMECGRYINGKWYIEDAQNGQLSEITGVTHWSLILDSMLDTSDDD